MPRPRADHVTTLIGVALLVAALSSAGGAAVVDSRADRSAVAATTGGGAPVAPHAPVAATLSTDTGAGTATNVTVTTVTVWTAPRGAADRLTNRSAIRNARSEGRLTRDSTVAMNDTLVFRLEAPGLADRLARAEGGTVTERFLAATAHGNGTFMLQHLNPTVERPSMAGRPNGTANTTVVAAANDTYYVVTRPWSLAYGYCPAGGCESDADADWTPDSDGVQAAAENVGPEDAFAVVTVFDGNRRVFGPNDWDYEDPLLEYVGTHATVRTDRHVEPIPWPDDGRVHVESTLAAGTRVTVNLTNRSDDGPSRSSTTVLSDGGDGSDGSVTFPGVTLSDETTFAVEVITHGRVIERVDGVVGAEPTPTASATPDSPNDGVSTPTAGPSVAEPARTTTQGTAPPPTPTQGSEPARTTTQGTEPARTTTQGTGPGFAPVVALLGLILGIATARHRSP